MSSSIHTADLDSSGTVVVVTGAGSGIGNATARLLATQNARLLLVGRDPVKLERTSAMVTERGAKALTITEDLRDPLAAQRIVDAALTRFGRIDCLVNNAGVPGEGVAIHELSDELWEEIIETNLTAAFRLVRSVLPFFLDAKSGVIVNVASTAALTPMRRMAAYSAAKAGLLALTRTLALDYADSGTRCNCVCPGLTRTPMTENVLGNPSRRHLFLRDIPIGRAVEADEVARLIAFLCLEAPSSLTGEQITLDGGRTLVR